VIVIGFQPSAEYQSGVRIVVHDQDFLIIHVNFSRPYASSARVL
jgi:hypothetical protein